MRPLAFLCSLLLAVCTLLAPGVTAVAQERPLLVFATASMKNALDDVNEAYAKAYGVKVTTSYAASSALVKQIEQGAAADVFISADRDWMDYGAQKSLIRNGTRHDLLSNRLVLIAPKDTDIGPQHIGHGFGLAALVRDRRIATADVPAVPAGKYARAALEKLGIWESVAPKLAMTENVRVALALVARGEAALGIVYETDAKAEPQVRVVGTFPADSHPEIIYPVAATVTARPEAQRYLDFLRSAAARAVFERHGFVFLNRPTS